MVQVRIQDGQEPNAERPKVGSSLGISSAVSPPMVKCSRLLHLLCKVLTPFINVRNKINNYGKTQIISSHCNLLTQIKMTNIV